jgi:hypothetical protein
MHGATHIKVYKSSSKYALQQAVKAQRGSTGIALYCFFNLGARWEWVVSATPRPLYPRERDPVHIV